MVSVQSTSKTDSDEPDGLVNHLPDELCVDVTAPRGSEPKRLYEQVRAALNRHLQSEAQRLTVDRLTRDGLSKIARDVEPSALRELDSDALEPLVRSRVGARGAGARRPWVALPESGRGRRDQHWHFYYQVGPQRVSFSRRQVAARRRAERRARELINLLNLSAQGLIDTPRGPAGAWSLSGSQANWLTSSLPFSCGSPAGLPVGESKKPGQFRFGPAMN